jgi:hypothetical protein
VCVCVRVCVCVCVCVCACACVCFSAIIAWFDVYVLMRAQTPASALLRSCVATTARRRMIQTCSVVRVTPTLWHATFAPTLPLAQPATSMTSAVTAIAPAMAPVSVLKGSVIPLLLPVIRVQTTTSALPRSCVATTARRWLIRTCSVVRVTTPTPWHATFATAFPMAQPATSTTSVARHGVRATELAARAPATH